MASSGMPDLRRVAAELRAAEERGLLREMAAGLRAATVFLEADVRAAAAAQMPQSGGLARQQASQEIQTVVLRGGVRMRTVTRGSMQTDKGYVRHPVFGTWIKGQPSQQIPRATGWWTKTLTTRAPLAKPLIEAELRKAVAALESRLA